MDPLQEVLQQATNLRAMVNQQIAKLPAPSPARDAFLDVDRQLANVETKIRTTMPKPPSWPSVNGKLGSLPKLPGMH